MKSMLIVAALALTFVVGCLSACQTGGPGLTAQEAAQSVANAASLAAQDAAIGGGDRDAVLDAAVGAAVSQAMFVAPEIVSPEWRESVRTALALLPVLLAKSSNDPVYDAVYKAAFKELHE